MNGDEPRKPERPLGDEDFDERGEDWREPVELDAVDEASRESMDASDPPAAPSKARGAAASS